MARWFHHEVEFQKSLMMTKEQMTASGWQGAWDKGYMMDPQAALGLIFAESI